jgi:hypothetical protein
MKTTTLEYTNYVLNSSLAPLYLSLKIPLLKSCSANGYNIEYTRDGNYCQHPLHCCL